MLRLAVLTLALLGGCATMRVNAPAPPGWEYVLLGPRLLGITICTSYPMSWVRSDLPPDQEAITRSHEDEHRRSMLEHSNCRSYWNWRNQSRENRIRSESRAFCAGAQKAVELGHFTNIVDAAWRQAADFRHYDGLSQEEATIQILLSCRKE